MLKDQQEKAKTTQEGKIFTLFDSRLGGFKASGKDEKPLGLKEDMEKNTPKEIQDAVPSLIKQVLHVRASYPEVAEKL